MDSHALLKEYILLKLREDTTVTGGDIGDLVKSFGLTGIVSNTQLMRALRSLKYKDKKVMVLRPIVEYGGGSDSSVRSYLVKLP